MEKRKSIPLYIKIFLTLKMNIILINPPQVFSDMQVAAGVTPPLGLGYLGAVAKQAGHKVKIIDALAEGYKTITPTDFGFSLRGLTYQEILNQIPQKTDLIGISNHFSFAFPIVKKLAKQIKIKTGSSIVLGGAHPSATVTETLKFDFIDYVVISEGEESLLEICKKVAGRINLKGVDGVGYKENGKIKINPKTKFIKDIDSIPFPARELLPMEKYFEAHEAHGPSSERWTSIISSRGCPFKCSFCTPSLWNYYWRGRSAKNIVDEMEYCIDKYKIREFLFEDENMTLHKKRTIEICNEIISRGLDIKWQAANGIRASTTDYEMLKKMKESGCEHIAVAPESGSIQVLNEIIHKQQSLEEVKTAVKNAHKLKIKTAAYFMFGLPSEKKEDVKKSIAFARELAKIGLDEVCIGLFIPLPGAELYDKLRENGKITQDYSNLLSIGDHSKSVSWSEYISDKEIGKFRRNGYIQFYATKFIYNPKNFIHMISNILSGKEETKTERTIRVLFHRLLK